MALQYLTELVTVLIALSVATERIVEIIKGMIPFLSSEKDARKEQWRRVALHVLAMCAGIFTAWLALPAAGIALPPEWASTRGIFALGLLASGGSGFWNSILSYLLLVKTDKRVSLEQKKKQVIPQG